MSLIPSAFGYKTHGDNELISKEMSLVVKLKAL